MTASLMLATIVLIHGLGGDRHVWDDVIGRLGKHRVITIELPPPAPLDDLAHQIAAELRARKATPAIVVGHSLGGIVAAHLPLVDPGAVRALVVVDMVLGPTWTTAEIDEMRGKLAADREAALRDWFGRICKPAQLPRLLGGLRRLSNDAIIGYLEAMRDGWVRDDGRAIAVPTLLMISKLIDRAHAGFDHVARLKVETFAQSMHWIMWDEPDKFVATLLRFADENR